MPPRGRGGGPGFGNRPGGGRGNPYPYCRFYPGMPRRWWAYPGYGYPAGSYPSNYRIGMWQSGYPAPMQQMPGSTAAWGGMGYSGPGYW